MNTLIITLICRMNTLIIRVSTQAVEVNTLIVLIHFAGIKGSNLRVGKSGMRLQKDYGEGKNSG